MARNRGRRAGRGAGNRAQGASAVQSPNGQPDAPSSSSIPLDAYVPDQLLDAEAVAALWRMNTSTLYKWRCAGAGPAYVELSPGGVVRRKDGSHRGGRGPLVRYRVTDLRRFLTENRVETDWTLPRAGRPMSIGRIKKELDARNRGRSSA